MIFVKQPINLKSDKEEIMIEIRQEDILEQKETENVVREAFWNVYTPGCCEHFLVHKIRRCHAFVHQLNLVALSSGMIVGHVINIKSYIEGDDVSCHEILCLGPISVLPQFQRQGVGSALIAKTKQIAVSLGYKAIILCGDPSFYAEQGFYPAEKFRIRNADNMYAEALQVCPLCDAASLNLAGKYHEDEVYKVDDAEFKEFDKDFLPKKAVSGTPSQRKFLEIAAKLKQFKE